MYTLPNLLTLFRFGLIPVFLILFFSPLPVLHWAATAVFLLAALTDWLDGWLARLLEQESELGRLADPLADKLLSVSVFLALWIRGLPWGLDQLAVLCILVIAGTEAVIATLSGLSAWKGIEIRPSPVGKTKTAVQFLTLLGTLLLLNLDQSPRWGTAAELPARPFWVGVAFGVCALLTLATLAVYIARYPSHREQLRMVREAARRRSRQRRQTLVRVARMSPGKERRQEALEAAREIAREIARAPRENQEAGNSTARSISGRGENPGNVQSS
jgi:CDP-diacylglycerol--glycerol-3-phosphate 3-phosphatidyltransferase